jgi:chaperonin GroEL
VAALLGRGRTPALSCSLSSVASPAVGKILDNSDYGFGYNAQSGEYGDLISQGVIDPTKVVRCALQGAASIAGLLITTEAMVHKVATLRGCGF